MHSKFLEDESFLCDKDPMIAAAMLRDMVEHALCYTDK
jgi:hypothetical protein